MLKTLLTRWKRRLILGCCLTLTCGVFYCMPLGDYLLSLVNSLYLHGVSQQTWVDWRWHSAKLLRFFTGPPTDAEMVAFFRRHRSELDQLAAWYGNGRCRIYSSEPSDCTAIEQRLGLTSNTNTFIWGPATHYIQIYRFDVPAGDWWRNTNPAINSWAKWYMYLPPALPSRRSAPQSTTPIDPDQVMHYRCAYPKSSLDRPVPELMAEKYYAYECGYFPLGDGWYLALRAYYTL